MKEVTIPPSVTVIGEGAFCDCQSLKEVVIPPFVTSIEKSNNSSFSDENWRFHFP